jgi:hypothetical protein
MRIGFDPQVAWHTIYRQTQRCLKASYFQAIAMICA